MKNKTWLWLFAAFALLGMLLVAALVIWVDPYMHYHAPLTDTFYYSLSNQRSQNDGIVRHMDYDAIITGTSLAENFKTSEFDELFGADAVKVAYSGGSYKEFNDTLAAALRANPDIRYIVRSLDGNMLAKDKDYMRDDLGVFPEYLYDRDPFNDVQYVFNRSTVEKSWNMLRAALRGEAAGITSFDAYSGWMGDGYTFGADVVLHDLFQFEQAYNMGFTKMDFERSMTDEERETIRQNIEQNVVALAEAYPDTQFYYFFPPCSAAYWGGKQSVSSLLRQLEMEQYAAALLVSHDNIHLFGWTAFDITDDLNNYKDSTHYGEWVNSWMLVQMKNGVGRLTEDNYEAYFQEMYDHYSVFDYNGLFEQEDYEDDLYAAQLLYEKMDSE